MPCDRDRVRDLHDLQLLMTESQVSLTVLHQAALASRDETLLGLIIEVENYNQRQRRWVRTRIREAAAQALTAPQ